MWNFGSKRTEEELKRIIADEIESRQKAEAYFDFLAHDIANILSPVAIYADILKTKSNDPKEVIGVSDRIGEQCRLASSLIVNLKKLEILERRRPDEIDMIGLRTLFSSLEDNIRSGFPNKEITTSYDIPDVQSMNVKGGVYVEDVLRRIYDNAVRYSTGSVVELEISVSELHKEGEEPFWQIEISDHGPGISENVKSHIWENINFAGREFKDVTSSLPFCVSIIKRLGGELLIIDRVSLDHKQGTVITIRLPKSE